MSRPHWLPEIVWMGKTIGQWPITVFGGEEQAKTWASEAPWNPTSQVYESRRIWSVAIPADTVTYSAEKVPATFKMKQETP
jgi:hypothetical protein